MRATEGHALESIDDLEANADDILDELRKRVRREWSMQRIQYNFAHSPEMLPIDLMNIFSISSFDLNMKISAKPAKLGAEEINGHDEIWIAVAHKKYVMSDKGIISIKQYR